MRIENNDGFPSALLEVVKRGNEISVTGNEYDAVKLAFKVVDEHLGRNVYVRTLFLGLPNGGARNLRAGFTRFFCKGITGTKPLVVTFNDLQLRPICG